jgi:hypothetical protein
MSVRFNARRAVIGLTVAGAAVALVASLGASASAGIPACPKKTLCVWQDVEGEGKLVKNTSDGISNKLAKKMNNEASSAINNRGKRAYLYDKRNGKGEKHCISPHDAINLSEVDFNDIASSSKNTAKKKDCLSDIT